MLRFPCRYGGLPRKRGKGDELQAIGCAGVVLLVAAAQRGPLANVTDQPVVTTAGKQVTADQVRNAIVAAPRSAGS
jgi:hypothetical protein